MKKIEIYPGRFIYRCEACGFEYPVQAVTLDKLGPPPAHACKQSNEVRFEAESE
jgi:hypothetical protein